MRRLATLLTGALLVGAPAATLAQTETSEQRDTRLKKAQAYLDLATTLFRDKDFAGALKELQRAEPLLEGSPILPLVRFNIARCLEELGRPAEAVRAYQRYLTLSEAADDRRDKARAAIKGLEPSAIGTLVVECAQPGTIVRIEGLDQPSRPCPVRIEGVLGGDYPAEASAAGFREARQTIAVQPGRVTTHRFDLTPAADGKLTQVHTTTRSTQGRSALPWIILGAGAGAVATGVAFHVVALGTFDELESGDYVKGTTEWDSLYSEYEGQRLTTYVAYGVGAALVGAGVYLLLREDDDPADTAFVPLPNGALIRF